MIRSSLFRYFPRWNFRIVSLSSLKYCDLRIFAGGLVCSFVCTFSQLPERFQVSIWEFPTALFAWFFSLCSLCITFLVFCCSLFSHFCLLLFPLEFLIAIICSCFIFNARFGFVPAVITFFFWKTSVVSLLCLNFVAVSGTPSGDSVSNASVSCNVTFLVLETNRSIISSSSWVSKKNLTACAVSSTLNASNDSCDSWIQLSSFTFQMSPFSSFQMLFLLFQPCLSVLFCFFYFWVFLH